ncbi:hypothetical protein H5410_004486 [Solanum commersonii]|uniref:Uncharacterized protein n=1 Tax=Solanum commersonii TaxID=4109 RepID=A0A9J6B7X6_SOLCO|nr:hypothetical protein H5410_004486 [Solanum commersonii]
MTPILEEITIFMGKGSSIWGADLRNKRPIIPKNIDANKFLDLLKINQTEKESLKNGWVSLDFLYESNQGGVEAWKVNGCFAFMVVFLGLIISPKWDKHISIHLARVGKALTIMESPTIIPMILADMLCALTKCKNKETEAKIDFPKGILACEEKHLVITSDELYGIITEVSNPIPPHRVMRQLARVQEVPPNHDMSRFVFDTPPGFAFDTQDILKIWFRSIISEQSEMVVEQDKGKVVHGYLSLFRDPVTFGDTPKGSNKKRKDNHIIRQLEKELEKAKVAIARQELQNVEEELKHAEEKLARLEEELSRIHLA